MAIFGGVDISEVPGCHLLRQMSSQWGSQKLLQGLVFHEITAYLSIFNQFQLNDLWPYYQKHVNQIIWIAQLSKKPSFENIVDCKSFLESNSPDVFALCETNLDDSIDSDNFCVRGYLPLIRKDSSTHMHGLAVYVKEGLPFAQDLSLEKSAVSYLCFWPALLDSVSYLFFPLLIPFFVFVYSFWFYFI